VALDSRMDLQTDECLFDVAMDAGAAAVVALVVTESLRSLIELL
jgi:hypothetical protein